MRRNKETKRKKKKNVKGLFTSREAFLKLLTRRIENSQRAGCESQLLKKFPGMKKRGEGKGAHVKEEENFLFLFLFFLNMSWHLPPAKPL